MRAPEDATNTPGQAFRYTVDAFGPDLARSEGCAEVEVMAIPYFGSLLTVALAAAGGLGAVALARRRTG